jgi:hypothetical protein
VGYCTVAECERELTGHGDMCDLHSKRKQRGQSLSAPVQEKLTLEGRFIEVCIALADSDDDDQFKARRRAALAIARQLGRKGDGERIKEAMAAARARGVHVGRPPKMSAKKARELLAQEGSITRASAAAKVTRTTFRKALAQSSAGQKGPPF